MQYIFYLSASNVKKGLMGRIKVVFLFLFFFFIMNNLEIDSEKISSICTPNLPVLRNLLQILYNSHEHEGIVKLKYIISVFSFVIKVGHYYSSKRYCCFLQHTLERDIIS